MGSEMCIRDSLDMGIAVYDSMGTFEDIHVEQYEELV